MLQAFKIIPKGKSIDKYVGQDLKNSDFINSSPRIYKGVQALNGKQMQ